MSDDDCVETYWCGKCPLSFDFCRCSAQQASVSPMAVLRERQAEEAAKVEAYKQEDRYEHIDLIVKTRADGTSWFDILHDYITQDCDSVQIECQSCGGTSLETFAPHCDDCDSTGTEWTPCHCGMETMGGMEGTLQQCYDHTTNLGQGLQPIDVARALVALADERTNENVNAIAKAVDWARKEIEFEEYFENKKWEQGEE